MSKRSIFWTAVFCLGFAFLSSCSKSKETEVRTELDKASDSVSKAYDKTTDVIKNVVEDVNDAVY